VGVVEEIEGVHRRMAEDGVDILKTGVKPRRRAFKMTIARYEAEQ
jgi:hypothetical protein